jgi:hypothetical protein
LLKLFSVTGHPWGGQTLQLLANLEHRCALKINLLEQSLRLAANYDRFLYHSRDAEQMEAVLGTTGCS